MLLLNAFSELDTCQMHMRVQPGLCRGAPDPTGGAYSAPSPDSIAECRRRGRTDEEKRENRREGEG